MPDQAQILAEAYKRGLLPPDRRATYEEAMKRGLVPKAATAPTTTRAAPANKQAARTARGNVEGFFANMNERIPFAKDITSSVQAFADDPLAGMVAAGQLLSPGSKSILDHVPIYSQLNDRFDEAQSRARAKDQAVSDEFAGKHPVAADLAKGTGLAASVALPGPKGVAAAIRPVTAATKTGRAVQVAANAGRSGVAASVPAAGYGLGFGETGEERLQNATESGLGALALGAAIPAIVQARKIKAPRPVKSPGVDALRSAKDAAYKAVDDMGAAYTPSAVDDLIRGIDDEVRAAKISPSRHPKAYDMVQEIKAAAGAGRSLTEIDQLRQVVARDVANATDEAEQFFGRKIIDNIDEFLDAAGPASMSKGKGPVAAKAITDARAANTKLRKVEKVTEAIEKAKDRAGTTGAGGNVENAIRQNIRAVSDKMRNATPDEAALMTRIKRGDPMQNLLRLVGKLSPTNPLMGTTGAIGGAAAFGPLGSAAVPATGYVAKTLAERATHKKVAELIDLMASGGQNAQVAQQSLKTIIDKDPQAAAMALDAISRVTRAVGTSAAMAE